MQPQTDRLERMLGKVLCRGLWAERPPVIREDASRVSHSPGDLNVSLDELQPLLGTTLEIREALGNDVAANWFTEDGSLVRWVGGDPFRLVTPVLELLAGRTLSDLGIEVKCVWRKTGQEESNSGPDARPLLPH